MVRKIGGSLAVIIPKSVARESRLTEGTALEVSSNGDGITMRRASGRRRCRPIGEIVKKLSAAAYARRNAEMSHDVPVGKELW